MSELHALTTVTISGAVVFGMVLALLGSIKLELARRLDLSEGKVGGLLSALNLALVPTMLISGVLIDRIGVQPVLVVGSMITAGAIISMSFSPTFGRAFTTVIFLGVGVGMVSLSAVVLMPLSFFRPPDPSAGLNLGHVFVALGALIMPLLADLLQRLLGFRRTAGLLALTCLVPAFFCLTLGFRQGIDSQMELVRERGGAVLDWHALTPVLLAGLVFCFYSPLEGAISVWTTTYLTDEQGFRPFGAALLLTGFWTTFVLGRLLFGWLRLNPLWDSWILFFAALATLVLLANLSGTDNRNTAGFGLLTLGFVMGPIFPTLIGIIFRKYPTALGTTYGVIFAIGSFASLILAPLMGVRYRHHFNTATGETAAGQGPSGPMLFRIPFVLGVLLTFVTMVFGLVVGSGVK